MWQNFVFLVIFDTCDVVYNLFISLLPPIVLDNLFGLKDIVVIVRAFYRRSLEITTNFKWPSMQT